MISPNAKHDFKVGDAVNWSEGTDIAAGVVSKVSANRVTVTEYDGTLLNGPGSGEPDALTCDSGGFLGHMSGKQRYDFTPTNRTTQFSLRSTTYQDGSTCVSMKEVGISSKGSMRSWGVLRRGMHKHYDYGF